MNAVSDDSQIRNVVLMLGSFHTFMNLLGAIGTLMDGSRLEEIRDTVYDGNAIVHMMSGKAGQQAFHGHLSHWWISVLRVRLWLKSWRMTLTR